MRENPNGGRAVVYLLDGDAAVRDSLSALLGELGVEVRAFASAAAFLAEGCRGGTGCVVADAHLPDMDGAELLERLRGRGERLPVILLSSDEDLALAVRALRAGALDWIEKPFVAGALLERVRQTLRR